MISWGLSPSWKLNLMQFSSMPSLSMSKRTRANAFGSLTSLHSIMKIKMEKLQLSAPGTADGPDDHGPAADGPDGVGFLKNVELESDFLFY